MTLCSAENCSNHDRDGVRMFRFPTHKERQKKWLEICRKKDMVPKSHHRICSFHFDGSQFVTFKGKTKLKKDAVPTLINLPSLAPSEILNNHGILIDVEENERPVPDAALDESGNKGKTKLKKDALPTLINLRSLAPSEILSNHGILIDVEENERPVADAALYESENKENIDINENLDFLRRNEVLEKRNEVLEKRNEALEKRIEALERENLILRQQAEEKERLLSSFLTKEQINALSFKKSSIKTWSEEVIIKGLKIRFAVGKSGYDYLRALNYPTPSYSTLNRRIAHLNFKYGVIQQLFHLLKVKIEAMNERDKNCCLIVDEMEIAQHQDFDKSTMAFTGNVTLGEPGIAKHYTVVMLRGLSSQWKQVVAHELTGPTTTGPEMKALLFKTVYAAQEVGLKVRASTSDMGSNNRAYWSSVDVSVTRNERKMSYTVGYGDKIFPVADVPHLIKNMRSAFLSRILILPQAVCDEFDLPSTCISSRYLKQLWIPYFLLQKLISLPKS